MTVLVYVRQPEVADRVVKALGHLGTSSTKDRVALFTGTIRGHERDQLVNGNPVFRALHDSNARVEHSVYLVSTLAGEVGVDLDADHVVCDLASLDSRSSASVGLTGVEAARPKSMWLVEEDDKKSRKGAPAPDAATEAAAGTETDEDEPKKTDDLKRRFKATEAPRLAFPRP